MPRIRVSLPDELLQKAATRAKEIDQSFDEYYGAAIAAYVETNQKSSPGSLRSRSGIPSGSPKFTIEIPEDLFQRADKLAKRLGKRRDVMYAEALARHVQHVSTADSALDQGHDLPSGAWRSKSSS